MLLGVFLSFFGVVLFSSLRLGAAFSVSFVGRTAFPSSSFWWEGCFRLLGVVLPFPFCNFRCNKIKQCN